MRRRRLALLALVAVSTLTLPANAADDDCFSAVPIVDPHAANYQCDGVRPGMTVRVQSKKYGWMSCGASFAFRDQFGQRYLTMPGTCFLDYECIEDVILEELPPPLDQLVNDIWPVCLLPTESELEPVYKKNGPVVTDSAGKRIGSLAYAVNKHGINLALIRIDPKVALDPSVPLYGGPTRLGTLSTNFEEAWVYSPYRGSTAFNARTGVLSGSIDSPRVLTEGVLSGINGASVMKKSGDAIGMSLGYLSTTGYEVEPFGPALERARSRTGLTLRLMTAPLR